MLKKSYKTVFLAGVLGLTVAAPATAYQDDTAAACDGVACQSAWKEAGDEAQNAAFALAEDYKTFMRTGVTELSATASMIALAEQAGFERWTPGTEVKPGSRFYVSNRGRALVLVVGGRAPVSEGVRIVASHIDSPRLELKGRPLKGKQGFALFETNYHGGIKTYQWTNIPLALTGRIDKTDGTSVSVEIGLDPSDPILMIPDLSPHTARDQMKRSGRDLVAYEELDPIVASGPHGDASALDWLKDHLLETYGISEADLVSAELALVPAFAPRDMGFDRRLTAIYGQDDRVSGFASFKALAAIETPPQAAVIYLADNEETGNNNNTGASSSFLTDLMGELLFAEVGDAYRQPHLTRMLRASKALSIDVNPGVNPFNPGVWELGNAPRLGYGVNIKIYGRGFNANSEFLAWTRGALDSNGVPWQTATYKVGRAGGGTLGRELARYNIDTIDFGIPILSIHTPYAVSDKMDVMALRDGISAFLTYQGPR